MPTKAKIIHGQSFEVNQPYAEGHTLSAVEAKVLNQVRAENIGNNLREAIKEAITAGKSQTELNQLVADYDTQYSFTSGGAGPARVVDPVEREAQRLARELIKVELAKTDRKLTVAPDGESKESWAEKIQGEVERIAALEPVLDEAKKNVAAKKKQAEKLATQISL